MLTMIDLKVKIRAGASLVKVRPLFTFDSRSIIVANGSDIKVFSIQSGECIQTLRYHKRPVVSLQECKKNVLQILSCCEGGTVVRWDYSEGKLLQVYDGPISTVATFYAPDDTCRWFMTKKFEDHFRLYSCYPKTVEKASVQMVLKPVLPIQNTVAFGFKGKFVAAVYDNNLTIYELEKKIFVRHKTGERMLKCVVCHPSDDIVATGDNQGRVLVWSNIFDSKRPIRSIYHWHTLPVADLVFSTEGSYMYSGGGEAALVKWNLFSEQKSVLPRLGSPICHVNISTDNSYVVSAHEDNALQIINSQRIVVQLIQGLTQGHFQGAKSRNLLPTGMVYDPRTKAIVMNGRPGHLQFYDITKDKQLFNLDITGRNFISQERDSVVLNTDVHKTAIDDRGIWLATTEYWYDEETSPQLWLKFWEFDTTKQTFGLNTNVILPHNKEVNCILFRPVDDAVSALPLAVTTSNDCKFKIWSLQQDTNSDQKQTWSCTSMGCYRDLPAGDACFSEEGSLLAVAFGKAATLWTVDSTALKAVLCNDKSKRNIVQTHFGRKSYCHLLVCHDGTSITVWDVLSLSITWIVHTEVQIIVGDRASDVIAAFCQNQNLIVFRPNDPFPVYSLSNASKTPVISAVFVSKNTSCASRGSASFYEKSQLYFFNQEQKLLTLTDEPDTELETPDSTKRLISQNIPKTPFGMLQAEHKISNVETVNPQPLTIHTKGDIKMVTIPCPTLQDPILLCSSLLSSFLIPKQNLVQ